MFEHIFDIAFEEPPGPISDQEHVIDNAKPCTFSTGTKGIQVALRLVGGPFDGRKFSVFYPIEPPGVNLLKPLLKACGLDLPSGPFSLSSSDVVGRHFVADTFEEEYDGEQRLRLRNFRALKSE
jgi:hypothetical protein